MTIQLGRAHLQRTQGLACAVVIVSFGASCRGMSLISSIVNLTISTPRIGAVLPSTRTTCLARRNTQLLLLLNYKAV